MKTGYSGTVTQSVSFSMASFSITAGTYTGDTLRTMTIEGSFTKSGTGVVTAYKINGIFTGNGATSYLQYPVTLDIRANITHSIMGTVLTTLTIASGKTLTVATSCYIALIQTTTLSNLGTISGSGTGYLLDQINLGVTRNYGIVNCPVKMQLGSGALASRAITLSTNTVFGSTLINAISSSI